MAGDVDGRAGIDYERLYGPSLQDWVGNKPWRIPAVGRQLAEAHASVHDRTAADLPARRAILARRIRRAGSLTEQARSAALKRSKPCRTATRSAVVTESGR